MRWTYDKVKEFYTRVRRNAKCTQCKREGVTIGKHPSGKTGQPVRVVGADLKGLKEWIRKAGWLCHRCRKEITVTFRTPPYPTRFREPYYAERYPEWRDSCGTGWISEAEWAAGGWSGYEERIPLEPGDRGYPRKKWRTVVKYPKLPTAAAAGSNASGGRGGGECQEVQPDLNDLTRAAREAI